MRNGKKTRITMIRWIFVNYLINSIDKNEYYSNPIHYTLIDEV